jgi:pyruvate formate lyase activating enzyme
MSEGFVFDIKKYALHDGPGIRTAVFLKGCPLHCLWCHNPEGQDNNAELIARSDRCLPDCRDCLPRCPEKAIRKMNGRCRVDPDKCRACGACADICPTGALEIAGRRLSARDVVEEVAKDAVFHEESGGGVTFSGGEPLAQPEFLEAMLRECRERGIHATVDTCGFVPPDTLKRIQPQADLFLFDLKVMDSKKHAKLTGESNALILENLKWLARSGARIVVRIPLIPGVNDDDDNIVRTAEFLRSLDSRPRISLLPYHRLGQDKRRRLVRSREGRDFPIPSAADMERVRKRLESYGFEVTTGE